VGNYVVYQDGRPVLVDVGRPTYTRETFSRDRYKIWAMQSAYHNLPTINNQMQGVGAKYAASGVHYQADDAVARLNLDLASAYPTSAGVTCWARTIRLTRGVSLEITDEFELRKPSSDIVLHFITPCEVEVLGEGQLRLQNASEGTHTRFRYVPPELRPEVETIELDDAKLATMWGPRLRRISLRAPHPTAQATWSVRISQVD
jgi:hypothetical protein